jgi:hypothetical protein
MDLKQTERKTATRLQNDEAETLARLAAGLSRLEVGEAPARGEESDLAHALRPLSSAR